MLPVIVKNTRLAVYFNAPWNMWYKCTVVDDVATVSHDKYQVVVQYDGPDKTLFLTYLVGKYRVEDHTAEWGKPVGKNDHYWSILLHDGLILLHDAAQEAERAAKEAWRESIRQMVCRMFSTYIGNIMRGPEIEQIIDDLAAGGRFGCECNVRFQSVAPSGAI